jgi:TniQ
MAHGKIWPAHPKPLPSELLSSWIVRIAEANSIKLQTMTRLLFGTERSPWNRDIDRSAPPWLIQALSQHTGANYWDIFHTTLVTYRTRLYPRRQSVGQLRWILPINSCGTRHTGFGQQFCPACLATDSIPHFRKQWRVALFTYCPAHQIELHDACPDCGAPVVHYRGDFGKELKDAWPMYVCHACGADFREAERRPACFPSEDVRQMFDEMLRSLGRPVTDIGRFDLGYFDVMQ